MVVRDHHQVDARQLRQPHARGLRTRGAQPYIHGHGPFREHRGGEQVDAAELHQHRGVTDPGGRRLHRQAGPCVALYEGEVGLHHRRGPLCSGRSTVTPLLPPPAQEFGEALMFEGFEVAKAIRPMVGFGRVVMDIDRCGTSPQAGSHGQCGHDQAGASHHTDTGLSATMPSPGLQP